MKRRPYLRNMVLRRIIYYRITDGDEVFYIKESQHVTTNDGLITRVAITPETYYKNMNKTRARRTVVDVSIDEINFNPRKVEGVY